MIGPATDINQNTGSWNNMKICEYQNGFERDRFGYNPESIGRNIIGGAICDHKSVIK